jgi:hypothetical protein
VLAGGQAAEKEAEHGPVERRDVAGLAAAHPVAVLDHLAINPVAARVPDVVLDGVVAGQPPPEDQAGRHQLPGSVADHGKGLAGALHRPQERLHLRHHPHGVGVQGAAGQEDRVELPGAGAPDRAIDGAAHSRAR